MKLNLFVLALFTIGLCYGRTETRLTSPTPSPQTPWRVSSTITPYPMTCFCDCCEGVGCTPTRQGVIYYQSPDYCSWADCFNKCSKTYRACYIRGKNDAHCSGSGAIHFKIHLFLFLGLLFLSVSF